MECEDIDKHIRKATKKRQSFGRLTDVAKRLRLQSHITGDDCNCKRLKCFTTVTENERKDIIKYFNSLKTYDEQNLYLARLITVMTVARRRSRKTEAEANFHDATYRYRVHVKREGKVEDIPVCRQAFIAMHGITKRRIEYIAVSVKLEGQAPTDGRGKHKNRPHKLSEEKLAAVKNHIASLKGRNAHFSLDKTSKVYLPEELNVKKLHEMYMEKNLGLPVSYETYRTIFVNNFNISFGYPRTDTCSFCDESKAKITALEKEIKNGKPLQEELEKLKTVAEVHLKRAVRFYELKRKAKHLSRSAMDTEAIAMDYQKNLPLPNVTTNDVYYCRQLSFYSFNIHQLSDNGSVFYTYTEDRGKKGADNAASMLHDYIHNYLPPTVRKLYIFCGGQNKNYTLFRFLHYMVSIEKRLDFIKVTFPIRGHSYMEPDKNMGLINQKTVCELPEDWREVFRNARTKPSPFKVVNFRQKKFRSWTSFLAPRYKKQCTFAIRPVKVYRIEKEHCRLVFSKNSYGGPFISSALPLVGVKDGLEKDEFYLPPPAYLGPIPLKKAKYMDLQKLKKFCKNPSADRFYSSLKKK